MAMSSSHVSQSSVEAVFIIKSVIPAKAGMTTANTSTFDRRKKTAGFAAGGLVIRCVSSGYALVSPPPVRCENQK